MELKDAGVTILAGEDKVTIEIRDREAATTFLKVTLTPVQFCQVLSRLSNTDCKAEVFGLDRIGKKMEHKEFEFEMPDAKWEERSEVAAETALRLCPDGWIPSSYFGSQDSFFKRDGKNMARTTIRRWGSGMEHNEHVQRHKDLHNRFDELLADYIANTHGGISDSILNLIEWSHKQTIEPDHK